MDLAGGQGVLTTLASLRYSAQKKSDFQRHRAYAIELESYIDPPSLHKENLLPETGGDFLFPQETFSQRIRGGISRGSAWQAMSSP